MTITMERPSTRKRRSDVGEVRQTVRDVRMLTWLAEMYGAPMDLIASLAGVSTPRAYGLVSRWKKAGWVQTGQVDAGPTWVWPTQATARAMLGRDNLGSWRPALARVAHLRATAAVRIAYAGLDLDAWTSERELTQGTGYRKPGVMAGHTLDGLSVQPGGNVAIEVELHAKAPSVYFDQQYGSGLLNKVANAARDVEAHHVTYWGPPEVLSVVQTGIQGWMGKNSRSAGAVTWDLRDIREVSGWKYSAE